MHHFQPFEVEAGREGDTKRRLSDLWRLGTHRDLEHNHTTDIDQLLLSFTGTIGFKNLDECLEKLQTAFHPPTPLTDNVYGFA